jgi:hypothetical protein
MQKFLLIGHLGKDPEMKYTPGGTAITTFSVASTERWKNGDGELQEHTEWFNANGSSNTTTSWFTPATLMGRRVSTRHSRYDQANFWLGASLSSAV